jgi:hypothetical protein
MCGIVAVLRRVAGRPAPSAQELRAALEAAEAALHGVVEWPAPAMGSLDGAVGALREVDRLLRGEPGVTPSSASPRWSRS